MPQQLVTGIMELRREQHHQQHHHLNRHLYHQLNHHHRNDTALLIPSSCLKRNHHDSLEEVPTHNAESHAITIENMEAKKSHVIRPTYILGIPIHKLSPVMQFIVCTSGVMFFYLVYGYTQEWLFRVEGFREYGWFITLLQFGFYSIFGTMERRLQGESGRRISLSMYMLIAFLTVATIGLSNASLGYLNYPTQVIFKSCKLLPVMFGGILIQGKRYSLLDGLAVLCMSIGLLLFNLADLSVQPNMDQTGVLLISVALTADAMIGNLQEKALRNSPNASNLEMIFYSYSIGFLYILAWVSITGSLMPAIQFCMLNPKLYLMIALFSLTGYLGVNFILALVRTYGALLAVTVTTFRKTITVILSFLIFTKPFTQQYVWSGLLVLLGVLFSIYSKNAVNKWLQLAKLKLCCFLRGKKAYTSKQFSV